jgi:riboflavin biosynthesis pyrimidine reductase
LIHDKRDCYDVPDRLRSWLRVNFVASVDGAATENGLSGGLSGESDKRVFDILRRLCDVVLVGAKTVRIEGYGPMRLDSASVDWRVAHGLAPQPVFAIASGSLNLDPASRIFTEAPVRPIVITTEQPTAVERARFDSVADVVPCGDASIDGDAMVAEFTRRRLVQVLCEGGPTLFGSLLAIDCVDELCLTVSPMLEAGSAGRITNGTLSEPHHLALEQVLVSGSTLMLRYLRAS